jgi:ADP-ribose pyrophosphatase YjhB (NUDIX family)
VREVWEETGIKVEVVDLSGIYTDPGHVMLYDEGEVRQQFSICFRVRWRVGCLRVRCVRGGDCRCAATGGMLGVVPALSGRGGRRPTRRAGCGGGVRPCRWSAAGRDGFACARSRPR